jgi:hypothetical protein
VTSAEFNAALASLGVTPHYAWMVLGISERQCYRLVAGVCPVSLTVEKLLRSELNRCRVREFRGPYGAAFWQGYRDGQAAGPLVSEKWQAQWFALDLAR